MDQKDRLAAHYAAHHQRGKRYGYLFCHGARGPYLQRWIGAGKKVLDLGCRDGMLTAFFAKGNQVLGVDVDRTALALAEKKLGIATAWLDLNGEWPFGKEEFDCIVACEILEHLFLLDQTLGQIHRSLKPGGLFIGSVPNAFRMRNRLKFLFGREYETDPTHVRQFSWQGLHKTLSASFSGVEIVPLEGKILPFWNISASSPARLRRLFAKDLLFRGVRNGK